jgi:hypothetical protein
MFFRPSGARGDLQNPNPRLTPWATIFRPLRGPAVGGACLAPMGAGGEGGSILVNSTTGHHTSQAIRDFGRAGLGR